MLISVFNLIAAEIPESHIISKLTQSKSFILTLIKLRLNVILYLDFEFVQPLLVGYFQNGLMP